MKFLTSLVMLYMVILTFSCNSKLVTEDELKRYVVDKGNGLTKKVETENYRVQMTYRPTDLLVAQELGSSHDTASIGKLRKKYGNHNYFILSLSKNEREAIQAGTMPYDQFSELLQTISFRMAGFVNT